MQRALPSDPAYLKAAFKDLGLSERPGPKHSARVLQLFKASGHPEVKNDETAWCAAAVGGWLAESGYKPSGSLMARSYTRYGVACDLNKIVPRGAIIVWPRGAPPTGHVNICLDDDGTFLTCIGGNQGNGNGGGVTISRERKGHALSARLPAGVPVPKPRPKPPAPVPQPEPEPEIMPQPKPKPDTAVVTVDKKPKEQAKEVETSAESDAETRGSWLSRKWKALTGWFGGGAGVGVLGYLTDPWVIVAIGGLLVVVAIAFILFMGPGDVRAWVRRQVS